MKTRNATIDDATEIFKIEKRVFKNYWSFNSIKLEFTESKNSRIFVLEVDCKVIGYIFQRVTPGQTHIINMAIDLPYQHKGCGKFLLKKTLEKDSKDTNVFLEVKEANLPAIKLYSDFGFEEFNRKENYYSDGSGVIFMTKKI